MDVSSYKIRVYLADQMLVVPSSKQPVEMMGTVLSVYPIDKRTGDALQQIENIPYIVCGKYNYGNWKALIQVRWDNDEKSGIDVCRATLVSTTISICSTIWDDKAWEIRRADKQLRELKPKTALPYMSYNIEYPRTRSKSMKIERFAEMYGSNIDFSQVEKQILHRIADVKSPRAEERAMSKIQKMREDLEGQIIKGVRSMGFSTTGSGGSYDSTTTTRYKPNYGEWVEVQSIGDPEPQYVRADFPVEVEEHVSFSIPSPWAEEPENDVPF